MVYENKIRELRKLHNESLEQLAEAVEISRDALRNYEIGKQDVKSEVAKRIAKHYSVSLDYLLFFNLGEE